MEINKEIALAEQYINSTHVSVFLTGKAGTGKTTLLHHLVSTVHKRCVVVAPTGVAAVNAGGVTIHSFFQLPFDPYLPDVKELVTEYQMPEKMTKLRKERQRIIRTLDLLIIDEISMVRADLLDAVDNTLRRYRRNSKPFGGVQLLMIGDVQQLPPVVTDAEKPYMDRVYPSPFFFHSKALQRLNYITIELTTVYRQQDDTFVRLLNNIRDNKFDAETLAALNSRCCSNDSEKDNVGTIRLTTHNRQADSINQKRMDGLKSSSHTFKAIIEGNFPESSASTDADLVLKEGAQVMFVKNDSSGGHRYYNGKIGTVDSIDKDTDGNWLITVIDEDGERIVVGRERWENIKYEIDSADNQIKQKVDGTFTQYPLKLAWAVTIHKAQGLTFDHVVVDAGQAFAYGQVYVALSRCRSLEGLVLSTPITAAAAFDNSDVMGFTRTYTPFSDAETGLHACQAQYFVDVLLELFDFSSLSRHTDRLSRIYGGSLRNIYPEQAGSMSELCTHNVADLISVSEKFRNQIRRISVEKDPLSPDGNAILQERVGKAVAYFSDQLSALDNVMQPLLEVEINNKEVANDFKENVELYREAVGEKLVCMKQVQEHQFSVEGYLKTKIDFELESDGDRKQAGKRKKKDIADPAVVYADNANPYLVPKLSEWRLSTCREQGMPAFAILTQKVLLAIADRLPKSLDELQSVRGMGKTKTRRFGKEILEVIGRYCDERGIPFVHAAEQTALDAEVPDYWGSAKDIPSWQVSANMFTKGMTIAEVAEQRGLAETTVFGHLMHAVEEGAMNDELLVGLVAPEELDELVEYILEEHPQSLNEVAAHFDNRYPYFKIRIAQYVAKTLL